ncbi:putative short chain dehydrogenase/reductase [Actinomycetospora sp. NBRC 106375]|uniref:mycofactocin-coupled SDR family oxidoreductase n=1 Tax=Actinomycetospora sp. NBRC 106375 TaxID=3032207 RepID=UPI0024A16B07|nr:mycofactocin-coupled SDR family oxidoreductase [Actinomycetospora sp. NBRC 106375]GLZ45394.1 putative short chain dehydrogenase/reductase [Actinomycetospora sp. NBRC 106375]
MAGRMEGKVVLVTGAARGQGRSHAVRLAQEGADVIAVDLCAGIDTVVGKYPPATREDLDQTVVEVEKLDRRVVARVADVRDQAALDGAVADGIAELGRLDGVVANAGIASYGRAWELDDATWQDMLDVNLTGVWHTAKAAIPRMMDDGGAMVFTSSIGGFKGIAQVGHYVSAKHGVVGLMRNLANELAPYRIRVNTVHPTNVDTHMIQNPGTWGMFAPGDPEPTQEKAIPGFTSLNALAIPWIESVDVANAVLFLLSDEARYITGATLPVDAGAAIK